MELTKEEKERLKALRDFYTETEIEDIKQKLCTLQRETRGRSRRPYFEKVFKLYGLTREEVNVMTKEDDDFYLELVEAYLDSNYHELTELVRMTGIEWDMPS